MSDPRPIGVFDSGVGGLTVARAILEDLPNEPLRYIGDTARCPYGPRPIEQVRRFGLELAGHLLDRDVKMLVVACNAISVAAFDDIVAAAGDVPVIGVIEPAVRTALRVTKVGRIGLIGTQVTVDSGAYDRAVRRAADEAGRPVELVSRACPAFVEHVERGDTASPELVAIARSYLEPLVAAGVDTLILGCTHYPLLQGLIQFVMGPEVTLVSSAEETAKDVYAALVRGDLLREDPALPRHDFRCTGDPDVFRTIAGRFIGPVVGDVSPVEEPVWS
jgi:glutamate racemase